MNHDYEDNGDDSVSVQLGALCLYPHAIAAVQHRDYGTEGMPSSTSRHGTSGGNASAALDTSSENAFFHCQQQCRIIV